MLKSEFLVPYNVSMYAVLKAVLTMVLVLCHPWLDFY